MKPKIQTVILFFLTAVFAVSAFMLVRQMTSYRAGDEAYAEASEIAAIPEVPETETVQQPTEQPQQETQTEPEPAPSADPYAQALEQMDLPALQQVNSDVIGWIAIPGTEISYPLVQGTDNDYYLTHTWNQNSSAVGAIFMDCRCSADFSGFNTIVYGHRMNNGSMFAALKHYKKQDFLQAHPQVYVTNASGTHAYRIYAAYEASLDGTAYYSAFSDETIKKTFIDEGVSLSVIRPGAVPTVNDHILTLSTCTGNGHATRWVVQAVME